MTNAVDDYRSAVPPHLHSWDLADPARLLPDLAAAPPLVAGRSLLCQEAIEDAMRRIGHRDWTRDDDERMTFAVGSVLPYANNTFQALRGELLIVTPHGWISWPDELAGLEPIAVVADRSDDIHPVGA